MHWSGRVPIEATLVLVINHPWVWRLINAAMLLLFCHSAGRLALASTGKSGATTTSLAFAFLMLVSPDMRSEEHTSELQSLMRISYAVFCLKKKQKKTYQHIH